MAAAQTTMSALARSISPPKVRELRGEETERGNLWRAVVVRNLDGFGAWVALQRGTNALWERFEQSAAQPRQTAR